MTLDRRTATNTSTTLKMICHGLAPAREASHPTNAATTATSIP